MKNYDENQLGKKNSKIEALIHYIKNCDYNNLRTLTFSKEDAVILLKALQNYNNPWIPYQGELLEEGEYMVTVSDDIAPSEFMKVRLANYYEKSDAFQGYGKGPNCKVLAYKKKDEPFEYTAKPIGKAVFSYTESERMYFCQGESVDILYEMNNGLYEYDEKSYMIRFSDGYTMPEEEFALSNIELFTSEREYERGE